MEASPDWARHLHRLGHRMSDTTAFPVRPAAIPALGHAAANETIRPAEPALSVRNSLAGIWSRLLVLLAALAVLKVLLIAGQSQNLFETHWRIGPTRLDWLNVGAFAGLVLLTGLALVRLGKECHAIGLRSVRAVNAAIVLLGLSFILLTFHNGDKNYLYPVLSGMLKWDSLVPYLANSFFFNAPFLGGWLFAYVALYYVLARTGREGRVLFVTAAFGCAYALLNLRDLIARPEELLISDCFGVIALLSASRRKPGRSSEASTVPEGFFSAVRRNQIPSLGLKWQLVPLGWAGFFAVALLRFDTQWHSHAAAYFLGLLAFTFVLFGLATALARAAGNSRSWNWFVAFFVVVFFLFTDVNFPFAGNYNHVLCLALTFPRYFAGDLLLLAGLAAVAIAVHKLFPQAALWWLDVICVTLIAISGLDLRLVQIMGVRLGWDLLSFGDSPKMMLRMAKPFLPGALLGLLVLVLLYALAVRRMRYLSVTRSQSRGQLNAAGLLNSAPWLYLAILFAGLAFLGVAITDSDKAEGQPALRLVQTSPLWKRLALRTLSREEFLKTAASLGLGDFRLPPGAAPAQPPRDLNVLVVFMESSYNKHLSLFGSSEQTQPLLAQYKERMELFPNFFSAFAGSIHARFATFTSLYPVPDFHAFTEERVPVKSLFEVLHERGYTCSMFYSSYFDYTGFRDFLKNRGLDEMYDADTMPGTRTTQRVEWGLLEGETLGAIRHQLEKYARQNQRFCLTYVPAAPHYPYDKVPSQFEKYRMVDAEDFTPRYLNELLYMDWVISSIIDQLKESGLLDHTLVVITNDHGEMLGGEDNWIGHGWRITPQLANTPLILMDPQRPGFHINPTIGTQVDLLPTILDRLNIPLPLDQLYEGLSLDAGPARAGRQGYLNSYKEFALLAGDQILPAERESRGSQDAAGPAVYTISNEGTKTVFTRSIQTNSVSDPRAVMARFDSFQESLLHNYDVYCASIRGAARQQAKR